MIPPMLIWNIRGVGNLASLGKLNKLVKQWKPKLVAILEPFISFNRVNKVATKLQLPSSFSNEAHGGKIWILWGADVDFDIIQISSQTISGMFSIDSFIFVVSIVYASCGYLDRRGLWRELKNLPTLGKPWVVSGEFNIIRSASEKIGGVPKHRIVVEDFNNFFL